MDWVWRMERVRGGCLQGESFTTTAVIHYVVNKLLTSRFTDERWCCTEGEKGDWEREVFARWGLYNNGCIHYIDNKLLTSLPMLHWRREGRGRGVQGESFTTTAVICYFNNKEPLYWRALMLDRRREGLGGELTSRWRNMEGEKGGERCSRWVLYNGAVICYFNNKLLTSRWCCIEVEKNEVSKCVCVWEREREREVSASKRP